MREIEGEQAVILADITIDKLIEVTHAMAEDESTESFIRTKNFISVIQQTKTESDAIHTKMQDVNAKVASMNGNIMEISATMEETGANVDSQTENLQNIGQTCNGAAKTAGGLVKNMQEMALRAQDIMTRVDQFVPELIQGRRIQYTHPKYLFCSCKKIIHGVY